MVWNTIKKNQFCSQCKKKEKKVDQATAIQHREGFYSVRNAAQEVSYIGYTNLV